MRTPVEILPGLTMHRTRAGHAESWYWFTLADGTKLTNSQLSRLPAYQVAAWARATLGGIDWQRSNDELQQEWSRGNHYLRAAVRAVLDHFPFERRPEHRPGRDSGAEAPQAVESQARAMVAAGLY